MATTLQTPLDAAKQLKQLFGSRSFQALAQADITSKNAHEYFGVEQSKCKPERFDHKLVLTDDAGLTKTIYKVPQGEGHVYVADFKPAKGSPRAINLELAGELITAVLFTEDNWKVGSRFQALRGWAQDFPSLVQVDNLSGRPEKASDERKLMAPYIKWLVRAASLDAKELVMTPTLTGFDPVREEVKILKSMVTLWRERGYKGGDSQHVREANAGLKSLYALFKDEEPVMGPQFDRTGVSNPLGGYNEGVAHPNIEYGASEYKSDDDFYTSFLALNAGYIRSDLFKSRRDLTVPTTYPGLRLDIPTAMAPVFGAWPAEVKKPMVSYLESNRLKHDQAVYLFRKFDGETPIGDTRIDWDTFQAFRKACHPALDLGDGTKGRYDYCDRAQPEKPKYIYRVTEGIPARVGKTMVLDEAGHLDLITRNQDSYVNGMPLISSNTRGAITDHITNFFAAMPVPLKNSAPDAEGLKKLQATVSQRVHAAYIPAWADIGDPTATPNLVTRETKVTKFMQELLTPLKAVPANATSAAEALENIQDDHLDAISRSIEGKLQKRVFNLHMEATHGVPDRAYGAYRNEEDKYNRWRADIATPTDTAEQVDAKMAQEMLLAKERAQKNNYKGIVPLHFGNLGQGDTSAAYMEKVLAYVQSNALSVVSDLASLTAGERLPALRSLGESAQHVDAKATEVLYNHTCERFLTHFSLTSEQLPYLKPQVSLEFSERRTGVRTRLTMEDYLDREAFKALTPTEQATVARVVTEKAGSLDEGERGVLKHLAVASQLQENDPNSNYADRLLVVLYQRAGQELPAHLAAVQMKPEEIRRTTALLLKDMAPRSAQKVLAAYVQTKAIAPAQSM